MVVLCSGRSLFRLARAFSFFTMKPKNRIYCRLCGRKKLLFESEKKALNFIKFNSDEIFHETGKRPTRAYYCEVCGGYHVTSFSQPRKVYDKTERVIEMYNKEKEWKKLKLVKTE